MEQDQESPVVLRLVFCRGTVGEIERCSSKYGGDDNDQKLCAEVDGADIDFVEL